MASPAISQQPLPALPTSGVQNLPFKDITKACEACRLRKIKCKPPLSSSTRICECCATSNRECVFVVRSNKRRRRRTDARVTQLEQQIEALGALVGQRGSNAPSDRRGSFEEDEEPAKQLGGLMQVDQNFYQDRYPIQDNQHPYQDGSSVQDDALLGVLQKPNSSSYSSTPATVGASPWDPFENPAGDVIDRGLISINDAAHLLVRFTQELLPHFPIVQLPEGVPLSKLRQQKPVLLLAILAAAAGISDANQNLQLNLEIQQTYANLVVMKGEKSLELLQSIMITTTWLCPPDRFDQLKFYQFLRK
ncbi:MAG: hypothetical protein Q9168_002383 [Polycauliona sp. 1 TL-2023]